MKLKLRHFILCSVLFVSLLSNSQENTCYVDHRISDGNLEIDVTNGTYTIKVLSNEIINISFSNDQVYGDQIYAPVINKSQKFKLRNSPEKLILSTKTVALEIRKESISFTFYHEGNETLKGLHFYTDADTTGFRNTLSKGEQIFGTGARALPNNRRGHRFQCYNQANYGYGMGADFLNYSIPHFMSSKHYMVLYDNPARAWFDIGKRKSEILEFSSLGGNASMYFIAGNSYQELIQKNTFLTGHQPMVPIWALGNLQSRFGYRSQAQTDSIVNAMIDNGYPLDAIIIDLYWFGEELQDGEMGNLSWDKKNWPDPGKMINDFRQKGVKTITISEPFFTRKSKHFKELDQKKYLALDESGNTMTMPYFYFGDAGLIDIFNPEARDWLWHQYDVQKQLGVAGWWGDLGEPEVHPDTLQHVNGSARELHGLYGHEWTGLFMENYEKQYPDERLFMMGRAAFAGSQRYGLIPWSGDVSRTWSGLEAQVPVMLGMGFSGLAYMHSDAGGFAQGVKTPELYTRWMQFATFTPIFRPHSDPHAEPEPIFYSDTVQTIIKRYIKNRYALLPYNYTLAWEANQTGNPLARSLFVNNEDLSLAGNDSAFMWGNNFLIAPVTRSGITHKKVALPKGVWFYYWNSTEKYEGDQIITKPIRLENIPVFVKAGSFIPTVTPVNNTDEYSTKELIVHYYHDPSISKASYRMYVDDGKTMKAFEKHLYEFIDFEYKHGTFKISNTGFKFKGRPVQRDIKLIVHNACFSEACSGFKPIVTTEMDNTKILYLQLNANQTIKIKTRQ